MFLEYLRCEARLLSEDANEVAGGTERKYLADLTYGEVGIEEHVGSSFDFAAADIGLDRHAALVMEQRRQIVRRQFDVVGQIFQIDLLVQMIVDIIGTG